MSQKSPIKKQAAKKPSAKQPVAKIADTAVQKLRLKLALLVACVAFLVYANTLGHQYVLDDYSLILENTVTQKGFKALPEIFTSSYRSGYFNTDVQLYRPLSKAMFAIEWQLAPHKPFLGHLINVLLFALTGFVLFHVVNLYFNKKGQDQSKPSVLRQAQDTIYSFAIPFIAALLFVTHPIHTEVVANIKSRDELLSFLFFLLTAWCVYRSRLVLAGICFFLALLSKESAITYLAVIPLMIYFSIPIKSGQKSNYIKIISALGAVALIFLLIRHKVLGNVPSGTAMIDNYLVGIKDFATQKATAIYLMGVYLFKLLIPHPLVSDGSFKYFPVVTITDWRFLLTAIVYISLIVYAVLNFKKRQALSFCILYFLITASLASNLVFMIGTNYGERLMYAPSLAFCLAAGLLLTNVAGNKTKYALIASVIISCSYSFKAIARNADWYDNLSLYSKDVKTAPESARTHFYLGNHITQDESLNAIGDSVEKRKTAMQGIAELQKAIDIYPSYADAYHKIAKTYMQLKDYQKAEPLYLKALEMNPTDPTFLNNYGNQLFNTGRYYEAKEKFEKAIQYNPQYAHAYNNLGSVYGTIGQNFAAKGNQKDALENFNSAIYYFQQAIKIDPSFAQPYALLSMTYKNIGDNQNADYYNSLFQKLQKK